MASRAAAVIGLVFAFGSLVHGQDGPGPGQTAHDKQILIALREAANHGADLFNVNGDPLGCYRVYQGALIAVRPFLEHRPDLQKTIDKGLVAAERLPTARQRAFAAREVMDQITDRIAPPKKERAAEKRPVEKKPTPREKSRPKEKTEATLWQRLGGEAGVRKVVEDFISTAAKDPKVNFDRGGKFKFTEKDLEKLEQQIVELISSATGGPLKYTGPDLRKAHKGMNITNAEFDATLAHLRKALQRHKVDRDAVKALINIVEGTRDEIVTRKKLDKAPEKRPEPKRPEDKKRKEKREASAVPQTTELSGRVTFQGLPLVNSYVTLISSDGRRFSTHVKDGSYTFRTPIPQGEYTVIVEKAPPVRGDGIPPSTKIPERFRRAATSGIRLHVTGPRHTHDVDLR